MSDLQKETVVCFTAGRVFAAIQPVYSTLPERFTTTELMRLSGLKGRASMFAAISVLDRSFRCTRNSEGIWRKLKEPGVAE